MAARIYFDNAATTPLDTRVVEAMQTCWRTNWGNPSSLYAEGREAHAAVDKARSQVADLLGAETGEVIFTSGGTEGNNTALRGVIGTRPCHIITSAIEHPAVLTCCAELERNGVSVTRLPVGANGIVDPASLEKAFRPDTRLVSIQTANNIVGTIQPVAELATIAHQHGVLFHTDAVQAVGKLPFDLRMQPIDLLSLSAHKFNGPKGVGALFIRRGTDVVPLLAGGGQEGGFRSGTENVPGIVGLGVAAEIARKEMSEVSARLVQMRDRIIDGIAARIGNAYLIGDRFWRLPGHVCVGFDGQEGEAIKLLMELDQAGIAVSSGSACSSSNVGQPSHVLEAMGYDAFKARGSLRITLGRFNTMEEVDRLLEVLPRAVAALRSIRTYRGGAAAAG